MALNRSDKSRILRRYFPGMTRNSEMSTEPNFSAAGRNNLARREEEGDLTAWRSAAGSAAAEVCVCRS